MGPWPHLWIFVFKAATLASELQVSLGPISHLWFLHAKQDFWIWIINLYGSQTSLMVLWMQNSVISSRNTSLHGSQISPFVFSKKNNVISTRINSLYGSQTTPVVLCMQNSVISTRFTSLHGSQTLPVVVCMQNIEINIRITSPYGSQPSSVVFAAKLQLNDKKYNSLWVPDLTYRFLYSKQRLLHQNCKSQWVPGFICSFCMQNKTFGSELLISIGRRPHLWFCECKRAWLAAEILVSMGPRLHLSFFRRKIMWLASE